MFSAIAPRAAYRPHSRPSRLGGLFGLWRSRRVLAELDEARLNDIRVTADEAEAEAGRPLWDVPAGWRR